MQALPLFLLMPPAQRKDQKKLLLEPVLASET